MGNTSQRKKERHAKKRKEKLKKQAQAQERQQGLYNLPEIAIGSNARHRERLTQQIPRAWAGELTEDAAVFDDAALATLAPELSQQVIAIRDALQNALNSRPDDALKLISGISRGSPLSEWRLLIRGLVDWLAGETDAARDAWKRLDPERRPGRIATVLITALRSDLEQIVPTDAQPAAAHTATVQTAAVQSAVAQSAAGMPAQNQQPVQEPVANDSPSSAELRIDAQQIYHAKLLQRVRFDRAALRVAEAGVIVPEEAKDIVLGPRKMRWLRKFIAEYGDTEPDLAAALTQAALGLAFENTYTNLFDEAIRSFPGPRHDRRNLLLKFFYYSRYENDAGAEKIARTALDEYLKNDLPKNEAIPASLRGAIASEIHLNEAKSLLRPSRGGPLDGIGGLGAMFGGMFGPPEDAKAIRDHFLAAVKAYPANGLVYREYVDWIEDQIDNDRLKKPEQTRLEKELAKVMQCWSTGVPEAIEPRLWLVDYYLEEEQLDEARPHVDYLAGTRQDNPRARAMPWKWQILEAMRLCRRKAWLAEVPARLDEAAALWPAWLSKQWLPYLRAAWTLRTGQKDAFEEQRRQICEASGRVRDSLADACMMLGAAQQMRAAAAELKPLRETLQKVLVGVRSLPLEDLVDAGSFFWDLHRVSLLYPAYRLHGKTIGKALLVSLANNEQRAVKSINEEAIQKAVLWGAACRFWAESYTFKVPRFFADPTVQRHPIVAAASVTAVLRQTYRSDIRKCREMGPILRAEAERQRDAYYRYWFIELADELDEALSEKSNPFSGFGFGDIFSRFNPEDRDDDPDDDSDYECNCEACQAERRAEARASSSRSASH